MEKSGGAQRRSRIDVGVAAALLEEPELIYLPLWREAFTWVEYAQLKVAGVYYGMGIPHGKGAPVIVVPGFLACDMYLLEMRLWLNRIGYKSYRSRIGLNAECPDILARRLMKTVNLTYEKHGRKVHLVGHSLGGVLARGVAAMAPEKVASVITLASPFRGVRVNPFVGHALAFVRSRISRRLECPQEDCFSAACKCAFPQAIQSRFPAGIKQTAIYCKRDGVVDWETCRIGKARSDFEVEGTHVGMAWNADVYKIIAKRLKGK